MRHRIAINNRLGRFLSVLMALMAALLLANAALAQTAPLPGQNEGPDNPYKVEGIVRGPTGPAEGVKVLLELTDMSVRHQIAFLEARTDTEGAFTFDLSAYNCFEFGLQFNTVSRRFIETMKIVRVKRNELPTHVELEVQPGSVARGVVVDDQGKPLDGVSIMGSQIRQQESDETGEWEAFGLFPYTQLRFRKEGYADTFQDINTREPQIIEGLRIVMASARELSGDVVDWNGTPVPYARVILQSPNAYQTSSTDESGQFSFRGVPDDLTKVHMEVMCQGYLPTLHEFTAEERDTQVAHLVIDSGAYVYGIAKLPSGLVAAGAEVAEGKSYGRSTAHVVADSAGRWRLGPFRPGSEIVLTILPPARQNSWAIADFSLNADPQKVGDYNGIVELWPGQFSSTLAVHEEAGKISILRRDTGAGGLPGDVWYSGTRDPQTGIVTGSMEVQALVAKGTFTMRSTDAGPQSLQGTWELREELGPSELQVAPSQKAVKIPLIAGAISTELSLDKPLTLSGEAIRKDGRPFYDGTVYLRDWDGSDVYTPEAKIEVTGRFSFDRLPNGTFVLQAVSADREYATEPMIVRGDIAGLQLFEKPPEDDPMDP